MKEQLGGGGGAEVGESVVVCALAPLLRYQGALPWRGIALL